MSKGGVSFLSGFIFSLGLILSGMVNPKKVIGFLDIMRDWDPSLAFVMLGAVGVNFIFFHFIKPKTPLWSDTYFCPQQTSITKRLVVGSALFGIGWGMLGICPGPGIVNLVTFDAKFLVFVLSMIAGVLLFKRIEHYGKKDS